MRRRFVRSLLLAALLVLLCIRVFAARETPSELLRLDQKPGFTTRIENRDGTVIERSGVPNADGLAVGSCTAGISSYALFYNGRLLMTVIPVGFGSPDSAVMRSGGTPTGGRFYKTTFAIDDTREIFLTGLTESTLEQVQTELTASALEDRYFNLTNVDFIDAEKEFTDVAEDGIASDANLCWAAATSNMLRFSGWGTAAGFRTEDDLFESFISAFTDAGGSYTYALDWFFNGSYQPQGLDGWSQLRSPGETGRYLSDYAADSLYQTYKISNHTDNLRLVFDALERDCAVGISIGNYISWLRSGGHAITLWGYLHDTAASPYSKEAYPAIFISDSDSDKFDGDLRREAPNRLRVMMMDGMFDGLGGDNWELDYPSLFPWRIDSFTVLEPFSESLAKDSSGTSDKTASADFSVQDLCVRASNFDKLDLSIYTIPAGQPFKISGIAKNNSAVALSSTALQIITTITQNGSVVWEKTTQRSVKSFPAYSYIDLSETCDSLTAGCYEATVRISASGVEEAYLLNNTRSLAFTVSAEAPDASGASVSVSIPEFDADTGGCGTLSFTGVDSLYPAGTELTWSVYEKYSGLFDDWVLAYQSYEKPVPVRYEGSDKTVQTLVVLRPTDPKLACVTLNAGQQQLLYHKLYVLSADGNTSSCSEIFYGQNALRGSEKLSVEISNFTTSQASITVTSAIYALRQTDNLRVDLWTGDPVSLAYGKSIETSITSWDAELPIGKYTIYAEAVYDFGIKSRLLSTLQVAAEKPMVFAAKTFRGSRRCAVVLDCAAAKGSAAFGVEYRKEGQEQAERVSASADFSSDKSKQLCVSFALSANEACSFRTFAEANGETTYGDWVACPAPSAASVSLQAPQTGDAAASDWEFTAPSDGVYMLTAQASGTMTLYDSADVSPKTKKNGELLQHGFYLNAGETILFCVQADAAYTVSVLTPDTMELCKTAFFTTADLGGEYFLQFTAPASGTYTLHTEGPWGWIYKLDENNTWQLHWHFRSDRPGNFSFTLEKGRTACFRFANMEAGDFAVTVSRPAPTLSVTDEGVRVDYDPEFTGLHLIALYDTDGRILDVRRVSVQSLDEHISTVLRVTQTGYVRVFQLDAERKTPLTAVKQAELP